MAVLIPVSPAGADVPLSVQTVIAQERITAMTVELSGSVEAAEAVPMGFRSGGRITEIVADMGDQVLQGQILARLDDTQAKAAEAAAEAQFAAAEAVLLQARQAQERIAALTERGAATQAALDSATQTLLAAQSGRDQAEAQLNKARQASRDTVIRSPAAGIVISRTAEPAQIVGATQTVLTIASDGAGEAVFHAPDFAEIDDLLGQQIELRILDGSDRRLAATISEISPMIFGQSGTIMVKARFDTPAGGASLGAAVASKVSFAMPATIGVPAGALMRAEGGPAVWVVDPATRQVALVPVKIDHFTDRSVELSEGLAAGAEVVTSGAQLLYPGRVVTSAGGKP
ncbi:efflux RND transporter periplasmic adaptor subunit [Sedimentimonas flavescens]|uniref:Efflux RND transporter periplasmic adaptor subunit n=1 Tax=Sedimentimonas flavescens TaxID=2851012 RepID=A0ABT2ZX29_9RHOB|nr:efflux RND transporter periplasmic adaptor subunit [Sedimentimonas flavescens]MCV2877860.1 efflux RND transporter periplasmic adaptor subunit [Sedimentimonas flavescens]